MDSLTTKPDPRPLYAQVEEILTQRIAQGQWRPGEILPAEQEIAQELGVSQGTLRKALATMERRGLIERRQGRGTFVTAQTSERSRSHYFRVEGRDGARLTPGSTVTALQCAVVATAAEAQALELPPRARVHRMQRIRLLRDRPCILEDITLPAARFNAFTVPVGEPLRAELYVLYQQRHGVFIARAEERLEALLADDHAAEVLGLLPGAPLLAIERIAFDIAGERVERRWSLLDTRHTRYMTELG